VRFFSKPSGISSFTSFSDILMPLFGKRPEIVCFSSLTLSHLPSLPHFFSRVFFKRHRNSTSLLLISPPPDSIFFSFGFFSFSERSCYRLLHLILRLFRVARLLFGLVFQIPLSHFIPPFVLPSLIRCTPYYHGFIPSSIFFQGFAQCFSLFWEESLFEGS